MLPRKEDVPQMATYPLRFLSHEQMQRIHDAALGILDTVGMVFDHGGALDLLEGAGCRVDRKSRRARFPAELVTKTIAGIPRRYVYQGRGPEFDRVATVDGSIGGRNAGGCLWYQDAVSGGTRRARSADWREFCRLSDALPNIWAVGNLHCEDVPGRTSDIHSVRGMLEAGRKCAVHGAATADTLRYQVELMLAVSGSREALATRSQLHHMVPPINPLYFGSDYCEQVLIAAEYGIPIDVPVMSIVGITSPITVAGTLAQNVAEELAVVTLAQTARPGLPTSFFIDPVVGDMRTGAAMCGAPESAMLLAAICQMGTEFYGLPTEAIGFDTDGFSAGQTMYQKAQNMIFQVLAGGKMVVGAGCTESINALDPVQLVIDDELLEYAKRWLRGIEVTDETLAVDVIARVGPHGDFFADEHTVAQLHAGHVLDRPLAERESQRQAWEAGGRKTLESRAREKANALLATHEVPPLPDEVLREMALIARKADEELSGE
jgi:trimethylamine---corrinoid protein Co-methyltransferase